MQRIVLALALTGAAGLLAPQCAVRAPRAVLRAEAAEAPAEATPAPKFFRAALDVATLVADERHRLYAYFDAPALAVLLKRFQGTAHAMLAAGYEVDAGL